ncbi:MAG: type II toxin-antitoxin system RatA family toxin [Armatimonadota bacterium]
MAEFSHTLAVQASSEELWTLVSDVRRVAELFPFTMVEEFCPREPEGWVFWRRLTIPNVAQLRWREASWVAGDGELRFQAVEGDLETFQGSWQVTPAGENAQLTLALEYAIPDHLSQNMPPKLVSFVMNQVFTTICGKLKETAEEEAG